MTDAQLIAAHGGPAKLARKLGWTEARAVQRINNWRVRGIPAAVKLAHPQFFLHWDGSEANATTAPAQEPGHA
ncbi:hypothetical protein [Delftia lacustris]